MLAFSFCLTYRERYTVIPTKPFSKTYDQGSHLEPEHRNSKGPHIWFTAISPPIKSDGQFLKPGLCILILHWARLYIISPGTFLREAIPYSLQFCVYTVVILTDHVLVIFYLPLQPQTCSYPLPEAYRWTGEIKSKNAENVEYKSFNSPSTFYNKHLCM